MLWRAVTSITAQYPLGPCSPPFGGGRFGWFAAGRNLSSHTRSLRRVSGEVQIPVPVHERGSGGPPAAQPAHAGHPRVVNRDLMGDHDHDRDDEAGLWRHDGHPAREAVGRAAAETTGALGAPLWEYPVWTRHWATSADAPCRWHRARACLHRLAAEVCRVPRSTGARLDA